VLHFLSYFVRHFSSEELRHQSFSELEAKRSHLLHNKITEVPGEFSASYSVKLSRV